MCRCAPQHERFVRCLPPPRLDSPTKATLQTMQLQPRTNSSRRFMKDSAGKDFVPTKPTRHKSYGDDSVPSKPQRRTSSEQECDFVPLKPTRHKSLELADLECSIRRRHSMKNMNASLGDLRMIPSNSVRGKSTAIVPPQRKIDEKQITGKDSSPDVIVFQAPTSLPPGGKTNKRPRKVLQKGLSDPTLNTSDFSFHRTMPKRDTDRNPATHHRGHHDTAEEFSGLFVTAATAPKSRPSLNQYGSTSWSSLSCEGSTENDLDRVWFEVSPLEPSVNDATAGRESSSYMRRLQSRGDDATKSKREAFRKGRSKRLHRSQRTMGSHTTESTATMGSSCPSLSLSPSDLNTDRTSLKDGSPKRSFMEELTLIMNGKLAIEETPRIRNGRK